MTMTASTRACGPVLVIERRDREQLRIELARVSGASFADVRIWHLASDGAWRPSRSGVAIAPRHLSQVIAALERIRAELDAPSHR